MTHDLIPFLSIFVAATSLKPVEKPGLTQIRASITLIDQSVLHIRENHIHRNGWIDYSYQWQTADHQLIIRWDNAHPVDLPTSPHHRHICPEENRSTELIQPSEPMTLEKVLAFIASQLT